MRVCAWLYGYPGTRTRVRVPIPGVGGQRCALRRRYGLRVFGSVYIPGCTGTGYPGTRVPVPRVPGYGYPYPGTGTRAD